MMFRRLALIAAFAALITAVVRCDVASAHDGVPLAYQPMCCANECVRSSVPAIERPDGDFQVGSLTVQRGRTFFSTNGTTITCPYQNGGIRCLFIPNPHVS